MRIFGPGLFAVALLWAAPSQADHFQQGVDAFAAGNYARAMATWQPLAQQGHSAAQFAIGTLYATGRGTARNYRQAAHWFHRAARRGHRGAQHNLGVMYDRGRGVPKDKLMAACWYHKAAAQGDVRARYNLSVMYASGDGVARDPHFAHRLMRDKHAARGGKECSSGNLF